MHTCVSACAYLINRLRKSDETLGNQRTHIHNFWAVLMFTHLTPEVTINSIGPGWDCTTRWRTAFVRESLQSLETFAGVFSFLAGPTGLMNDKCSVSF